MGPVKTTVGVYPRVCGGTIIGPKRSRSQSGLSPRVRGNRVSIRSFTSLIGSIPACAGEPPPPPAGRHALSVYPRVCGGTPGATMTEYAYPSVYPRVCGGTKSSTSGSGVIMGLSPRVRGNRRRDCSPRYPDGLSPRVRGNPWARRPACRHCSSIPGSIPACAGEPQRQRPCAPCFTVYPRVCGGTGTSLSSDGNTEGLSPRVRGNPSR